MAYKRVTYPKAVTPKGVAVFPYLNKPDDKFGKPVFKTDLKLTAEAAAPIVETFDTLMAKLAKGAPDVVALLQEDEAKRLLAAIKAKKAKAAEPAVKVETNEEGEETGYILLRLKRNGTRKDKGGAEVPNFPPSLFDAKRNPVTDSVWGGSEIKVSFQYRPWVNAKGEYGVKLAMEAVQVLTLVSGGGPRDGAAYGFGDEDGFEGTTANDAADTTGDPGPAASDGDGGDDF